MYIDGEIVTDEYEDTDTSAAGFRNALKSLGDVKSINLHINSPGGSVFEGIAIYNMLKQNSARINVYIDGLAASIASVIAMSGDAIFDKLDEKTLTQLMDDETWLTAQEAVDYGLADEVMEPNKAVASINKQFVSRYRHVPEQLIKQAEHDDNKLNSEQNLEQEQLNKIHEKALANAKALNISIEKLKEEF